MVGRASKQASKASFCRPEWMFWTHFNMVLVAVGWSIYSVFLHRQETCYCCQSMIRYVHTTGNVHRPSKYGEWLWEQVSERVGEQVNNEEEYEMNLKTCVVALLPNLTFKVLGFKSMQPRTGRVALDENRLDLRTDSGCRSNKHSSYLWTKPCTRRKSMD